MYIMYVYDHYDLKISLLWEKKETLRESELACVNTRGYSRPIRFAGFSRPAISLLVTVFYTVSLTIRIALDYSDKVHGSTDIESD